MVNEWIERAQGIRELVLTQETIDAINEIPNGAIEGAIFYQLTDIAWDTLDRVRLYKPNDPNATYEDVFHLIYGYKMNGAK